MRASADLPTYTAEDCYCAIMRCDILRHPAYINGNKKYHFEVKALHENYITQKNSLTCPVTKQQIKTIELDLDLMQYIQQEYDEDDTNLHEKYDANPLLENLRDAIKANAQKRITLHHTSRFIMFLEDRTIQDRNIFLGIVLLPVISTLLSNRDSFLIAFASFMIIAGCVKYNDLFSNPPTPTPALNNR